MTDDENAKVAFTPKQMANSETELARLLKVWLEFYMGFPTADNFDGVCAQMREYQTAWMNGRRRLVDK
jgi:hypothetical protein